MSSTATASTDWSTIAHRKRDERDKRIPDDWKLTATALDVDEGLTPNEVIQSSGILAPEETRITELSVKQLLEGMHRGDLTAAAVTKAFCKRSAVACQMVSSYTLIWILPVARTRPDSAAHRSTA